MAKLANKRNLISKNIIFSILILFLLLLVFIYPSNSILSTNFSKTNNKNENSSYNTTNKISQSSTNDFVEGFDNFYSSRYTETNTQGTYAQFNTNVENGYYSMSKDENLTKINPDESNTIIGNGYDNFMKCNSFINVSNEYCPSSDLSNGTLAPASTWLTGWNYRLPITITGSTDGALNNYKLVFNIYDNSGINSGYNIFVDGQTKSDFSDVRFTASDGSSLYDISLIQTIDSNSTNILVLIPSIPASPSTMIIYMYYGNPYASSVDNKSIFNFYEDFSGGFINTTDFSYSLVVSPGGGATCGHSLVDISSNYMVKMYCTFVSGGSGWNTFKINNLDGRLFTSLKSRLFYTMYNVYNTTSTGITALEMGSVAQGDAIYDDSCDWQGGDSFPYSTYYETTGYGSWLNMSNLWGLGETYYMQDIVSASSSVHKMTAYLNNTFYDTASNSYRSTRYNYYQSYFGFTGANGAYTVYLDNWGLINETTNEPTTNFGPLITTNSIYVGYVNNSNSFTGGINRAFPAYNMSNVANADYWHATILNFRYFNMNINVNSNFLNSNSSIMVYLYSYNQNNLLNDTDLGTWTNLQKQQFWNITSQPINNILDYEIFDSGNFTNGTLSALNITKLANTWLSNRISSQTYIGFGIQLFNLTQQFNTTFWNNSSYLTLNNIGFNYSLNLDLQDSLSASLSTELQYQDQFTLSTSILYIKGTNNAFSNQNQFTIGLIIESHSGSTLTDLNYFDFVIFDPSGLVYLKWRTISGTIYNVSTGIILNSTQEYTFTFDISKTDSKIQISILDALGNRILSPIGWQKYVSNEKTSKPSFLTAIPLSNNWSGNTSQIDHKLGYKLLYQVESTAVYTGPTEFDIDNIYANSGLLDTGFYCAEGLTVTGGATFKNYPATCPATTNLDFNEQGPLSVNINNLSQSYQATAFQYPIRDFRSMSGLMSFNSSDGFTNSQNVQDLQMYIYAYPYYQNGKLGEPIYTSLWLFNYSSGYSLWGYIQNNITQAWHYPDLPSGHPSVDFGFGFYWLDSQTLALQVKYYDVSISTSNPIQATTYGNYNSSITQDILCIIAVKEDFGNDNSFNGGQFAITDFQLNYGQSLPFSVPSIPTPDVPYIPPQNNWFSSIWNGISGFSRTLLSGNIFGALGGAWNSLWSALTGLPSFIANFIIGGIAALFWLAYNWLMSNWIKFYNANAPSYIKSAIAFIWNLILIIPNTLLWIWKNFDLIFKVTVLIMTLVFGILFIYDKYEAFWDLFKTNVNPFAHMQIVLVSLPNVWFGFLWIGCLSIILAQYINIQSILVGFP